MKTILEVIVRVCGWMLLKLYTNCEMQFFWLVSLNAESTTEGGWYFQSGSWQEFCCPCPLGLGCCFLGRSWHAISVNRLCHTQTQMEAIAIRTQKKVLKLNSLFLKNVWTWKIHGSLHRYRQCLPWEKMELVMCTLGIVQNGAKEKKAS